jgi:hypothetical protein
MADLIDRDALIAEYDRVHIGAPGGARKLMQDAPAVNRWIPCSERMPENRCGVIFTVDRGHPFVCVGYRINTEREGLKLQRWFDKLSGLNFSDYDVKAWMPMPDAYEPPEKE